MNLLSLQVFQIIQVNPGLSLFIQTVLLNWRMCWCYCWLNRIPTFGLSGRALLSSMNCFPFSFTTKEQSGDFLVTESSGVWTYLVLIFTWRGWSRQADACFSSSKPFYSTGSNAPGVSLVISAWSMYNVHVVLDNWPYLQPWQGQLVQGNFHFHLGHLTFKLLLGRFLVNLSCSSLVFFHQFSHILPYSKVYPSKCFWKFFFFLCSLYSMST